ncbi:unnamed protein product [Clonostachys rhizophaga]|uniref:Fungal N-terminal domain-containing protein n=1 Tax=Clonostachys rhizophaga TaxID=160324 RepID=A0A9N9VGL9_9HYPO|nr:unnamed protein product [Clonostachys rhizophaga]
MSVGISARDVLAVSSLAKDICSCLKEIGGAKTEYQDLERELECLQKALTHLDRLQSKKPSPTIDSIRFAALSCRRPLEEFLRKIRRYETSLGPGCGKKSLQGELDKLRFRFGQSDEIRKLQNYLSVHLGTINILLAEHSLETMMLASEEAESERLRIHQRLDDTQQILRRVQDNTSAQTAAYFNAMSILNKVHSILSGEAQSPWAFMKEIVVKACVSTQQIYSVVLDIKASIASKVDVRWSFFQDPLICEDALGRKFPVPSEYDFTMLNVIIRQRFQTGPGSAEVALGDFEITEATDRSSILSESSFLRPGSSLLMAILIEKQPIIMPEETCRICYSSVSVTRKVDGGGRIWCNVWFAVSAKKRKAIDTLEASFLQQMQDLIANSGEPTQSTTRKRQRITYNHESVRAFKNVSFGPRKYYACGQCQPRYVRPNLFLFTITIEFVTDTGAAEKTQVFTRAEYLIEMEGRL